MQVGPAGSATTAEAQSSQLDWSGSTHRETCLKLAIAGFLDIRLSFKMRVKDLGKSLELQGISYFYALLSILFLSKSSSSLDAVERRRRLLQ